MLTWKIKYIFRLSTKTMIWYFDIPIYTVLGNLADCTGTQEHSSGTYLCQSSRCWSWSLLMQYCRMALTIYFDTFTRKVGGCVYDGIYFCRGLKTTGQIRETWTDGDKMVDITWLLKSPCWYIEWLWMVQCYIVSCMKITTDDLEWKAVLSFSLHVFGLEFSIICQLLVGRPVSTGG